LGLLKALACVTCNPADVLGLKVGRLTKGAPADLLAFDLDVPWQVNVDLFKSKSKNSLFEDQAVKGKALRTVVDGRTVWASEIPR